MSRKFVSNFSQLLLESFNGSINVTSSQIGDADSHMAKSDILGGNILMKTTGKYYALFNQAWEDIRRLEIVWQIYSSHSIGLVLWFTGQLFQAHIGDCFLYFLRCRFMRRESLLQRFGNDAVERCVQRANELW